MASDPVESTRLQEVATRMVQDWIQSHGGHRASLQAAMQIFRGQGQIHDSARQLEAWFLKRLIFHVGLEDLFSDLTCDLLGTMLDQVDWTRIVRAMRAGEQ